MSVIALVLAAGSSSRLGRPKQQLVYRGETLLERAVRIARLAADEVIVVAREPMEVEATVVVNDAAQEGIASSIRCGVTAARDASRILITLCDQPLITPEHLRALVAVSAPIVASGYRGIAGVPAIFDSSFFSELAQLRGDNGARKVIQAHRDQTIVVPFEDAAVDIDTEDDPRQLT